MASGSRKLVSNKERCLHMEHKLNYSKGIRVMLRSPGLQICSAHPLH